MSERKPEGETFESFVDRMIRESMEHGEFDNLPGKGKPIPDLDKPMGEMWWVKRYMQREGLSFLPDSLTIRADVERELAGAAKDDSELKLRKRLAALNARISKLNATTIAGPATTVAPIDVEKFILYWRERHGG